LILISNDTLWATSSDLLSLDELTFESFSYDISLARTTAMTWLHGMAHIVRNGSLYIVSVEPQHTFEETFVINPLTGK
jgi:hypothetical protein